MKRGEPLQRRTRLRSDATLRRTRLSQRSEKRRQQQDERRDVVMVVRARDRTCRAETMVPAVRCNGPLDVHEPNARSRNEGDWLDPDRCLLLCRAHHDWTHDHPVEARSLGLLV